MLLVVYLVKGSIFLLIYHIFNPIDFIPNNAENLPYSKAFLVQSIFNDKINILLSRKGIIIA